MQIRGFIPEPEKPVYQSTRRLTGKAGAKRLLVTDMTESMAQTANEAGYPQAGSGTRDGFEEQKVLLSRVSRELDEYFAMRTINGFV